MSRGTEEVVRRAREVIAEGEALRSEFTPAKALRRLFDRLDCFRVTNWGASSQDPDRLGDRAVVGTKQAHVVSSRLKGSRPDAWGGRHMVVLDIDHQAWLVKSSTEGHYHLYIEVPGGIGWEDYSFMVAAMAKAGVLEMGYANASLERGHTDVRLPWIKKEEANG